MPISAHAPALTRNTAATVLAVFTLVLCALAGTAHAAANTFCGTAGGPLQTTRYAGSNGNWGDGDNWTNGLPDAQCDAVIPTGDTVTLTTTPGTESDTFAGASMAGLTIASGATVIVEGVSSDGEQGNVSQATDLNVGADGLNVDQGATLDIAATGSAAPSGASPGQTAGGAANVGVDCGCSGTPAPVDNAGTIEASSSDPAWGESLNVGGTVTNTGSVADASGLLTLQGQSNLPYVFDNTGSVSIASGASFTMLAGAGSSFTNNGTFANAGSATLQQGMDWIQSGGSETGNPVDLTGGETLQDSAGTGAFAVTDCTNAGLTGTIPAGQTVSVIGGCSGTTLSLGTSNSSLPVINDGTLDLLAPAGGGVDGIVQGTELDNHGVINATVDGSGSNNQMLAPLVNESGATVNLTGGELAQSAGTTTSNLGTVSLGAGSTWLIQGGTFSNAATIVTQVASATSLGQFNTTAQGTFDAAGTVAPSLSSGYTPAVGTEFLFVLYSGGSASGTFTAVTGGFSADYSTETASPGYLGLIYGPATPPATTTPAVPSTPIAPTTQPPKPTASTLSKLHGGAGAIAVTLSCRATATSCATFKVAGTVTERLRNGKLFTVAALASPTKTKAKPKLSQRVVTVLAKTGSEKPGRSVSLSLKLNATGVALLKRFHRLSVRVVISSGGKVVARRIVAVTQPKGASKRK